MNGSSSLCVHSPSIIYLYSNCPSCVSEIYKCGWKRKMIKQASRHQAFLVYKENSQAILSLGSKVLFPCPVLEVSSVQRRKMVKKTEQKTCIITLKKGIKIFHLIYKKRYSTCPHPMSRPETSTVENPLSFSVSVTIFFLSPVSFCVHI